MYPSDNQGIRNFTRPEILRRQLARPPTSTSAALSVAEQAFPPAGHTPSIASRGMKDYAGAWSSERSSFRFVYTSDDDGRAMRCPGEPVAVGWTRDGRGRWYAVDACEQHASQLLSRRQRRSAWRD